MCCVQSGELGACEPCLPGFIVMRGFSGTLLVVSILDIVLGGFAVLKGLSIVSVGLMGSF